MKKSIRFFVHLLFWGLSLNLYGMEEKSPSIRSIDLLIDTQMMPELIDNTLDLSALHLESLEGLTRVEQQQEILILILSHNLLKTVPSSFFPHLTILQISHNPIEQFPPTMLHHLELLKQFFAHGTRVSEIPGNFFQNVPRLEVVNLSNNQITCIHPELFSHVSTLKKLNLGRNKIERLDPQTFEHQVKLISLRIFENNLTHIPAALCASLTALESLDLSDNCITNIDPHAFDSQGTLKNLILCGNQLKDLDPHLLRYCAQLKNVNFSKNKLSTLKASLIEPLTNLEIINLKDNPELQNVSSDTIKIIQKRLLFTGIKSQLEDLPYPKSASELIEQLKKTNSLHEICYADPKFDNCFIINLSGRSLTSLDGIETILPNNGTLTGFFASHNYLEEIPWALLNRCRSLEIIDLSNNCITSLGPPETLNLPFVVMLNLSYNNITSITRRALANVSSLTSLNLSHNEIREIEPKAFRQLACLEQCFLRHNKLIGMPAKLFSTKNNEQLECVHLDHNQLGSQKAYTFPEATIVRFSPQDPQPLQMIAAKAVLEQLETQEPNKLISYFLDIPEELCMLIKLIASDSIQKHLRLAKQISHCLESFKQTESDKSVWQETLNWLQFEQWNDGIRHFIDFFQDNNSIHKQLLNSWCLSKLDLFEKVSLDELAHLLIEIAPPLIDLCIDAASEDLQLKMKKAQEIHAMQQSLTRVWSEKSHAALMLYMKKEEDMEKISKSANEKWLKAINSLRECYSQWNEEMQTSFFALCAWKLKAELINNHQIRPPEESKK